MATKRCKVLAQRKFAQGAVIPPSLLSNIDNNGIPVTPQKDNSQQPVSLFKNVSADRFVTFLCFQDTLANHPLLKKTPPKKKRAIVLINKCDLPVKAKSATPPKHKNLEANVKRKVRTKTDGKSLRNRTVVLKPKLIKKANNAIKTGSRPVKNKPNSIPTKVLPQRRKSLVQKKIKARNKTLSPSSEKPKVRNISSSDFSSDDETPLRAFRRKPIVSNSSRLLRNRSGNSNEKPVRKLLKPVLRRILRSTLANGKVVQKKTMLRTIVKKKTTIENSTRKKLKMMLRSKAGKIGEEIIQSKPDLKVNKSKKNKVFKKYDAISPQQKSEVKKHIVDSDKKESNLRGNSQKNVYKEINVIKDVIAKESVKEICKRNISKEINQKPLAKIDKIGPKNIENQALETKGIERKEVPNKQSIKQNNLKSLIKEHIEKALVKESKPTVKEQSKDSVVKQQNVKDLQVIDKIQENSKSKNCKSKLLDGKVMKCDQIKTKIHEKKYSETDKSSFVEKWLDESSHYKADNSFTKELINFEPPILEPSSLKTKRPLLLSHLNSNKKFKIEKSRSMSTDAKLEDSSIKKAVHPKLTEKGLELSNKCKANFNVKCSCGECTSCLRLATLQENLKRSIEPLLALDMTCSGVNSTSKLVNTPIETICKVDMFEPNKKLTTKTNVYEFNLESDASPPVQNVGFRQSLRQKRNSSTIDDKQSSSNQELGSDTEEHLFYVDISPNVNNKAIEGRLVKNSLGKFIRCKLIPKSEMKSGHQIKVNSWQDIGSPKFMEEVFRSVCSVNVAQESLKDIKVEIKQTGVQKKVSEPQAETSKPKSIPIKQNINKAQNHEPNVTIQPSNKTEFPKKTDTSKLVEAPVFRPTEQEYQDPLEYIEKITPVAAKFGVCKIIPPNSFNPECQLADDIRFTAYNQYLHRMLHRWGPSTIELCAIKKHMSTHNVFFKRPPLLGGIEADLPLIYKTVLNMGGLSEVMEKKNWNKVAEELRLPKSAQLASKLDEIYMKHLLTYTTLSEKERLKFFEEVELEWLKKYKRMLNRSKDPLAEQHKLLAGGSLSTSESESEYEALEETEDCVTKGRSITLSAFYKTATNAMHMWFSTPSSNPDVIPTPTPAEVESEYWKYVEERTRHICVNAASIDSGVKGYGFPNTKIKSNINRHPWNLKVLTNNNRSILRSLGRLMGVTVPTIHVGMVFTTCCWYRDPHNLPWIEYHHSGAPKIWYGIPDEQSENFRKALQKLVPSYCQNKTIWLPSDMTMVPPSLLTENGVSLCRTVQNPGEYILVFPRSFTSSICTGYVLTESVYFAPLSWLKTVYQTFQDIRNSCEPTIFSLDQLLIAIATDGRATQEVLLEAYKLLKIVLELEEMHRETLKKHGIKSELMNKRSKGFFTVEECYICRATLYLSKVVDLVSRGVSICLEHAVESLNSGTSLEERSPLLVYTHTREELRDIIRKLEARLITKK